MYILTQNSKSSKIDTKQMFQIFILLKNGTMCKSLTMPVEVMWIILSNASE